MQALQECIGIARSLPGLQGLKGGKVFAKLLAARKNDERGFTLIELLVVILIIAILAAIAIPVFLNQRKKGYVSQMEAAAKNAATAAESFATGTTGGNYSGLDSAALTAEGFRMAPSLTVQAVGVSTDLLSYCVIFSHASITGAKYVGISSANTAPTKTTSPACNDGALTNTTTWTP